MSIGFRSLTKGRPACALFPQECLCGAKFVTQRASRKYCSDKCSAAALMQRRPDYSYEYALSIVSGQIERPDGYKARRTYKHLKREETKDPAPRHHHIQNTHKPGSIAFMLLYGGTGPFTLGHGGEDRPIGRGGGKTAVSKARAMMVG